MKAIHATGYRIDQVSNQGFVKQTQARMRARAHTHKSGSNNLEMPCNSFSSIISGNISYSNSTIYSRTWEEGIAAQVARMDDGSRLCCWFINKKPDTQKLTLIRTATHCWYTVQATYEVKIVKNSERMSNLILINARVLDKEMNMAYGLPYHAIS